MFKADWTWVYLFIDDIKMQNQLKTAFLLHKLPPADISDGYSQLTFVTSPIQSRGGCLLVITVTNSCTREWMKSIVRCSSVVWNVTRDSHLTSSLHWVSRHSIVSVVITHLICSLTDLHDCILLANEVLTILLIVLPIAFFSINL